MKKPRCMIVDDEPLACESLRALLAVQSNVEVMGVAHSVADAVFSINASKPDLLFLDIQMPGGGGFEVLLRLEIPPPVIFVTAYDQYALRAFEVNAVDYLLKPVLPERLAEAIDRVGRSGTDTARRAPSSAIALRTHDMVLLEMGKSGHFRNVHDLLSIQADGKYSKVLCVDGKQYLVRRGIGAWFEMLPSELFVRLDRSLLVNRGQMQKVDFQDRQAELRLGPGKHIIKLGRHAATALRRMLSH